MGPKEGCIGFGLGPSKIIHFSTKIYLLLATSRAGLVIVNVRFRILIQTHIFQVCSQ